MLDGANQEGFQEEAMMIHDQGFQEEVAMRVMVSWEAEVLKDSCPNLPGWRKSLGCCLRVWAKFPLISLFGSTARWLQH